MPGLTGRADRTGSSGSRAIHTRRPAEAAAARDTLARDGPLDGDPHPAGRADVTRQLFLDCDGVLADFDAGAQAVLGMPPRAFQDRYGPGRFWKRLAAAPDFYFSLPLMPYAMELFDAVRHLDPIILTGLPRGSWAADQKVRWAAQHFPGTPIITTMARDKRDHAKPGDVLVDDTLKHRHLWEEVGGVFIHHTSAATSIEALAAYFPLGAD